MRFQDDTLSYVLEFVGPNHFRFMAPVCRHWKTKYHQVHGPDNTTTSRAAAASSLSTFLLYKREVSPSLFCPGPPLNFFLGKKGDLRALQWLYARKQLTLSAQLTNGAAAGGHLDLLKWLRANGCPWNELTCYRAAENGHLGVLKWARANGCPWDTCTCACAAEGGHLDLLKWLRANGCPWDDDTCLWAAHKGHLEVLKWAIANGCPWDTDTCACAAEGGHLDLLKWLRANECPWDNDTCYAAAEGGHLEVLKWARANGCLWDRDECLKVAQRRGHDQTKVWILALVEQEAPLFFHN